MRLNKEREQELEPVRMQYALDKLTSLGFNPIQINPKKIEFEYRGNVISLWPYSGWHSGKGIEAGRGIRELLKQLK